MAPLLPRPTTSGQTTNMAPDERQQLPVGRRNYRSTDGIWRFSGPKYSLRSLGIFRAAHLAYVVDANHS